MKQTSHLLFAGIFTCALIIFLYPLIFMRGAFLYGDNFVQYYPWFKAYSQALKSLHFPFWVSSMGSGFPLMAEGQIGGFYPLNIIMFFFLPLQAAYNWSVIIHFLIAGVFTYAYTRKLGADAWGATLAALVFCFGSSYAGLFCNIMTLRVLSWFPAVLLCFELYFRKDKLRFMLFAALITASQLLAGHIQMAVYSIAFYCIYFLYVMMLQNVPKRLLRHVSILAVYVVFAFLIALPQIALSLQLAHFSGRQTATLDFALWRSFPPYGILGLVFPYPATILASSFYIGIFTLFFAVVAICSLRQTPRIRPLAAIAACSLLAGFGQFNPLYVFVLKMTGFYSFRNPSRFLFFAVFALAILAGHGFSLYFRKPEPRLGARSTKIFRVCLLSSALVFVCAKASLYLFKNRILSFATWFVAHFIYGKAHHRYDMEVYLAKIQAIYDALVKSFSFSNVYTYIGWFMVILGLVALPWLLRRRAKGLIMGIVMLDLFVFGFYGIGFSGQIKPWSFVSPTHTKIFYLIKADPSPHRILPVGIAAQNLPNWSYPDANMTYGIDSVACYTPLVGSLYREALAGLETVDDSLGVRLPEEAALTRQLETLRLLNVGYVVSYKELSGVYLTFLKEEDGVYLYALQSAFPKVFFTRGISGSIVPEAAQVCAIQRDSDGLLEATVVTDVPGFVVFSQNHYPGWTVSVDGSNKEDIKVKDLVQGVSVEKGAHKVVFAFKPDFALGK